MSPNAIILESYCADAIALIHEYSPNLSRHAMRIGTIRKMICEREIEVKKISRDANWVSHGLAKMGRIGGRTEVWLHSAPLRLLRS